MSAARSMLAGLILALAACGPSPQVEHQTDGQHQTGVEHQRGVEPATGEAHGDAAAQSLVLTEQQISVAAIEVATAGAANIREQLALYGTIVPNAERVRQVAARFPGLIQSVTKRVGDAVKQGERLATIESNESLRSYAVVAPLAGVVIQRLVNEGEQAGAGALFTVADLSSVWAEIALFPRDVSKVHIGQPVWVRTDERAAGSAGRVVYLAPLGSSANQTITARILLDNAERRWSPGLFVNADVIIGEGAAAVAVRNSALQTLERASVVFVRTASGFEPRRVRLGRRDALMSEVLSGLRAGERYAADNSFILKAELGKREVEHDH